MVVGIDRALPDAAGETRFAVLLHQLEELGLVPLFMLAAGLGFHRRAARVGLHASLAPAGALGAAALDDHVPDLAGRPAAQPGLAVEDEPTADSGSPEDADQTLDLAAGPGHGLRSGTVPPPTPVPQKTPIRLLSSRPAPRWNSAAVATWTALPTRT